MVESAATLPRGKYRSMCRSCLDETKLASVAASDAAEKAEEMNPMGKLCKPKRSQKQYRG